MICHLVFPGGWEECAEHTTCVSSAHMTGHPETLNFLPAEWIETILGCATLNSMFIIWRNKDNKLHNDDGPALESHNGVRQWWVNGQRHRVDGPADIDSVGNRQWFLEDRLWRVDGPAVEWFNGTKEWWTNGFRHREDGPAFIKADGTKEWYLNHKQVSEQEHHEQMANKS